MQAYQYLPRQLPVALHDLTTLALDLRWNWYHGTDSLWSSIDAPLWEATGNPWLLLQTVSDQRLLELAADNAFLQALQQQLQQREVHFGAASWFSTLASDFSGAIAYFSMEFGVSEALPIYSGGLGILAGDFLKTACDLDVPVIGIGLLYQQGYFRQAIDSRGEQIEFYPYNDPTMLPITPLRDDSGAWVQVTVDFPGRPLRLRVWQACVGRRLLLLLDSNDPLNDPGDRGITAELYRAGVEMRLQQEIVLGIGGWRLLEQLALHCSVCHLNEGHAAFAVLERARLHMTRAQCDFHTALRATRAGNLFTTHTPVASGFDRFPPALIASYFRAYVQQLGIDIDELLALGRIDGGGADEPFITACLAVHCCNALNGVSRLHGAVSRQLFQPLFPRWPRAEVPVGHITNGVHMPSWDSAAADALWTTGCGKARWRGALATVEDDLRKLDDAALWNLRVSGRRSLMQFLDKRSARQDCRRGADTAPPPTSGSLFDADTLTLGLARRFAEYKRPNLLLTDPQRLLRLLTDRDRPVQLVIAGKAHPQDADGKRLLREWHEFLQQPALCKRAIFVEDYDMVVAAQLVQGVDVWINTPRRPWEACGTSGMKVLVNGGLNVSELDGWWAEAYLPEAGWALGGAEHAANTDHADNTDNTDNTAWDRSEAEQLYRILEQEVVPCFYRRDERGLPHAWIERMRESMAHLTTQYSSNRMLREYTERYYLPLAAAFAQRSTGAQAAELEHWHNELTQHWSHLHFGNVVVERVDELYRFEVQLYLDALAPTAVQVEIYADAGDAAPPQRVVLTRGDALLGAANAYCYRGVVAASRPLSDYTPRVVPYHALASVPIEADFILWYR